MEFKRYKLKDVGEVVGGATPLTSDSSNYDGDISWITPNDLSNHKSPYISKGERNITQKGLKEIGNRLYPPGTVLFSSRAPIGYVAIAEKELCTNQGFKSIIPDLELTTSEYLYYLLGYYKHYIEKKGAGTTFKEVSGSVMENIELPFPSLDNQRKIASYLMSIDQKISLNTRMNAELEAMAKQLYDYWFVQFDFPDENGKPYKSSGGKMVWNEKLKREIPEGWEVNLLGDILDLLRDGTHNPPKRVEKGIPLLTGTMFGQFFIKHSEATYITEDDYNVIHKQYKPQVGDIILTKIGTIGNVNYLKKNDIPIAIHCNSALLRFPKTYGMVYPLFLCKSDYFKVRLKALKGQSVQEFVSLEKIYSVLIEIPPIHVITAFNDKLNSVFQEIISISEELEYLTHLRDSLLPMLMNGQVEVG